MSQARTDHPHEDRAARAEELQDALTAFRDWKAQTAATIPASTTAQNDTFTVAFWNIQRIPFAKVMNPQYHRERLKNMMEVLGQFDAAAVSERFLSAPKPPHAHSINDNSRSHLRFRPLPHFKSHGLNISAGMQLEDTKEGHYSVCGPKGADCMVDKGFIITQLQTAHGPVTLATTHLDSNSAKKDKAARVVQLAEFGAALEAHAGERLIVMGDLNCDARDPEDNALLQTFLARHGLHLNARESGSGNDVIASRGLGLVSTMEYDNRHWTDHKLEAAQFRVTAPSTTIASATRR